MREEVVGSVSRLWRYPVKSMVGEEVDSAETVWSGFFGDRSYALVDVESSMMVSAKNPAKWVRMFECGSRLIDSDLRKVRILLPGGEHFDIAEGNFAGAETALSKLFGRRVKFVAAHKKPTSATIEQYHPEIDEDPDAGETMRYQRSKEAQAGTFTDMAAIHLVTRASLDALAKLSPDANFDSARFRPNILVETVAAKGYVESAWVGKTLAIGDEVRLSVQRECGRCVMTTLPQGRLPSDESVLRTAMRFNRGKVGVYASVLKGGKIRKKDRVVLM